MQDRSSNRLLLYIPMLIFFSQCFSPDVIFFLPESSLFHLIWQLSFTNPQWRMPPWKRDVSIWFQNRYFLWNGPLLVFLLLNYDFDLLFTFCGIYSLNSLLKSEFFSLFLFSMDPLSYFLRIKFWHIFNSFHKVLATAILYITYVTGGEKSRLNRDLNPGPLAYRYIDWQSHNC